MKIKAKIVLGLSIILATILGLNAIYSTYILTEDKTSYIYEAGLKRAEGLTQNFTTKIQSLIDRSSGHYLMAKSRPDSLRDNIGPSELILGFKFRDQANSNWTHFLSPSLSSHVPVQEQTVLKAWQKNLAHASKEKSRESRVIIKPLKVEQVKLFTIRIQNKSFTASYLINSKKLLSELINDSVYKNNLFLHDDSAFYESELQFNLPKMRNQKKGTLEFKTRDEQSPHLVSFVHIPSLNATLTSALDKSKAFSSLTRLLYSTLFFGLALIGLGILTAVFFSNSITKPLQLLVDATHKIKAGDYETNLPVKERGDEINTLSHSFNLMGSEIAKLIGEKEVVIQDLEVAKAQLEDLNKNLESLVEQRTKDLQEANKFIEAMINSLDQGLFVFDKALNCGNIYTESCKDLFETTLEEKTLPEILGKQSDSANIEKWAEILFSEKLPFESAIGLGPKSFIKGDKENPDKFKQVDLSYHAMRDDDGYISNVVVVATDMTSDILSKEAFKKKEDYAHMIVKISSSRQSFYQFIKEVEDFLEKIEGELQSERPSLDQLMLSYHTLNGGFGSYYITELKTLAQKSERTIAACKDQDDIDIRALREDFQDFKQSYLLFMEQLEHTLGNKKNLAEISKESLTQLEQLLQNESFEKAKEYFDQFFKKSSLKDMLSSYQETLDNLAEKTQKEMYPIEFSEEDVRVEADKFSSFTSQLIHLFRNIMDHAIEPSTERGDKPEKGKISIEMSEDKIQNKFSLSISDDGRGINVEKVREKLKSVYPDQDFEQESDEQVVYHIFDPQFSTTDQVSDLSGRGVGMSAVQQAAHELNGEVFISTVPRQGTRFLFKFPCNFSNS